MPTVPYAQLQISVNGGAYQTGGIDTSVADVLTLRFVDTTGITAQLFEIYDYPIGFVCPAGWSTDANGVYYYSTDFTPPDVTITRWGKLMFRLTGNNGIKDGLNNPTDMVDEATASRTASVGGFHSVGEFESDQFETSWVEDLKNDLDIMEAGGLSAPANPGDNYKICYALGGVLAWTDGIKTNAAESALLIGTTVAGAGDIRLGDDGSIYGLDGLGNTVCIARLSGATSEFGSDANTTTSIRSSGAIGFYCAGTAQGQWTATGVEVAPGGIAVASAGMVRLPEDATIVGLNTTPVDATMIALVNDDLVVGDSAQVTTVYEKAVTSIVSQIGANAELTVAAGYLSHSPGAATVSTTGTHRVHSDYALKARADDDDGDVSLLALSGTSANDLSIGEITDIANVSVKALTTVNAVVGANTELTVGAGYISIPSAGATASTSGTQRVHSDYALKARADDDDGDVSLLALSGTSANDLSVGEITDIANTYVKALTTVQSVVGANTEVTVGAGYLSHSPSGATVSTTGTHRASAGYTLKARAFDDDGDINLMSLSGTSANDLTVGEVTDVDTLYLQAKTDVVFTLGGPAIIASVVSTGIDMSNTLATPTIKVEALGAAAGKDFVVQAGNCNYGYKAGDLYLKSGEDGDFGTDVAVYLIANGDNVVQASSTAGIPELGFFGVTPYARQTVTGAKAGNVALATLLAMLDNYGLIIDNTT